jgi:hypothetical protein
MRVLERVWAASSDMRASFSAREEEEEEEEEEIYLEGSALWGSSSSFGVGAYTRPLLSST